METKLFLKAIAKKAEDGKIEFVASDETVDRSGESIPLSSWDLDNYKKSPRLLVDHDYRVESIVGVAKNVRIENSALVFEPVFHELTETAKTVKAMVTEGVLDTVSVGFLRKGDKKSGIKNELMEISFVAVPCNPSARAIKSAEDAQKIEEFVSSGQPAQETVEEEPSQAAEPTPEAPQEPQAAPSEPVADPVVPSIQEEAKGMTEDILEAHQDICMKKYPYLDALYMAAWALQDAYMVDTTPVEAFSQLVDEMYERLKNVSVPDQKEASDMIAKTVQALMKRHVTSTTQKAGRVLSEKNRGIIEASIDAMRQATVALEELLNASQGDAAGEKATPEERSKTAIDEEMQNFLLARRVTRCAVTALSESLSQFKFPRT